MQGKKSSRRKQENKSYPAIAIVIDDTWRRPPIIMYLQSFKSFHFLVKKVTGRGFMTISVWLVRFLFGSSLKARPH